MTRNSHVSEQLRGRHASHDILRNKHKIAFDVHQTPKCIIIQETNERKEEKTLLSDLLIQ